MNLRQQVNKIGSIHDNIVVNGITLFNCGFPITFDGSRQPIAVEKIQLTMALALASVCQTVVDRHDKKGFIDLEQDLQQSIIDNFTLPHLMPPA